MKKEEIADIGITEKKEWETPWICNPNFKEVKPLCLLHKQLDETFISPGHREELKNNGLWCMSLGEFLYLCRSCCGENVSNSKFLLRIC